MKNECAAFSRTAPYPAANNKIAMLKMEARSRFWRMTDFNRSRCRWEKDILLEGRLWREVSLLAVPEKHFLKEVQKSGASAV
ncbi:hypothetical protein NPIL_608811 [Nephila pilipes]|uniref:Uncharacterized protein n=1 Tax=Nephila pilipes TaxID=299642 RepID=A0A8X6MLI1_NEPPI|nr:hypothetical protein NPIL_608811 [Nephila pilipes]